ncbi:MAG: YkgJ family cysteine cluster protein, partial [Desulfovibrionaceae bacterium]|nr:YkgJ family cysteine cluster protein [Desulfovibrionaceae bacterium]
MDVSQIFECQMCGICCEGKGGIVVNTSDLERIANYLKLEPSKVIDLYGEYEGTKLKLRHNQAGNCIFFDKGKGCAIHEVKPSVCKAWPFFRGNLVDPISLALAKEFCPGIKRDVSFQDFSRIGAEYLQGEKLIAQNAET